MQQTILILFNKDNWSAASPDSTKAAEFGYSVWGQLCCNQDIQLARASIHWFKQGKFHKYWNFINNQWVKCEDPLIPTVIYDKCRNYNDKSLEIDFAILKQKQIIEKSIPIINYPEFSSLLGNKLNQVVLFAQYMPETVLLFPGKNIEPQKNNIQVIKNFYGSGGNQVVITKVSFPVVSKMLQQEFIPAVKNSILKDYRIVFLGNEAQYALSRIAQKDSLYTNLHQGASIEFVELTAITKLVDLAKKIMQDFEIFPRRIFAIDFLQSNINAKFYLIEVNIMPGLDVFSQNSRTILEHYLNNLTKYLLK